MAQKSLIPLLLLSIGMLFIGAALAQPKECRDGNVYVGFSVLKPENEVGVNVTGNGFGVAAYQVNVQTAQLFYSISWDSLTSTTLFGHFHRAPAGVNGPIVFFVYNGENPSFTTAGHVQNVWNFDRADTDRILNEGFYLNIHTQQFRGGEIRDQVHIFKTDQCWEDVYSS